jgi:hypothetical protein
MAEYIFMTDSNAQMIKIERKFNEPGKAPFVLKYMVASDESLQKSGFLQGIEANTLAFGKWSEDQTKTYGLQVRAMEAKAELSGAKAELSGAKAELSKSTAELADANKRNAAITEFVDLQFDELKAKR